MNYQSFEVVKVSNGYLVRPDRNWQVSHDSRGQPERLHIFTTWTDCSKWLRDAFEVAPPG